MSLLAPCQTISKHDLNTTVEASQIIIASITGLFYLVILILSIVGVWVESLANLCSSRGTFFVFLIGSLAASVNVFTNADNFEVKLYFRSSTVWIIGIFFTLFGAVRFFELQGEENNEQTLGQQQPSMGCVIGVITVPLFLMEAVLFALACTKSAKPSWETSTLWTIVIIDKCAFLLQKPVQVVVYLHLRNTKISCKENAQFYFRILSFFNLIEWVDSQVNVDSDIQLSGPDLINKLDGWFNVLVILYKTLIIDYRLLCCLLFLEHSVEIPIEDQEPDAGEEERIINVMTARDRLMRNYGCLCGCVFLTAPVLCGLYFFKSVHLGASVKLFAIIVNLAIIISGVCLLRSNSLEEEGRRESAGVKIMVCCLGSVGFICWVVKAALAAYWTSTAVDREDITDPPYIAWDAAKFAVRSVTTVFLMYLFMKINARALPRQNPDVRWNYFLVPVIILGIFSVFVETLIDQYVGPMDGTLRCEIKEESMNILLEVGPPMYLGFLIHVLLHFVIIQTKIGRRALNEIDSEYSSFATISESGSEYYDAPEHV